MSIIIIDAHRASDFEKQVVDVLTHQNKVLHLIHERLNAMATTIEELKALATETKKDVTRLVGALTDARAALADANAKLDAMVAAGTATQAGLQEVKDILTDADNAIEAAAPEVPAPAPAPDETPPPADTGTGGV